jgi:hypothetical protein
MDGHHAAQERVSNPDLTFHRNLALAVADCDALNKSLIASELYEISYCAGVDIPGLRVTDEGKGRLAIGTIMRRLFEDSMVVTVEGSNVTRWETGSERDGGTYAAKPFIFERVAS